MTTNAKIAAVPPDLPPRFRQPEGWRWHMFTNPRGNKMRFGAVSPKSRVPDAVIVCLPGLSEFAEKYFELAHDMLDHNLAFWVLDWRGQGRSERYLTSNPQKRHAETFDEDIKDLHFFLTEYVKHAAVHPDVGRLPLVMMGHSMGANIGMRYLIDYPGMFCCAAFSAPMLGILATSGLSTSIALDITAMLKEAMNLSYVFGGRNWNADDRGLPEKNIFSSDPVRSAIHNKWCLAEPLLQTGSVTFGWLHAAIKSCYALQQPGALAKIGIPCLIALAERERLVSNSMTRKLAKTLPNVRIMEMQGAFHEILMERDDIRQAFLGAFYEMLKEYKIKEKLKTF